jgi:sulfate permease, SulP family
LRRFVPKNSGCDCRLRGGHGHFRGVSFGRAWRGGGGRFSGGLPGWALPRAHWPEIHSLLPAAIGIAFLTYTEGILLARAFAAKNGYEIAPNQELTALGAANLCNGFFPGLSRHRQPVAHDGQRRVRRQDANGQPGHGGVRGAFSFVLDAVAGASADVSAGRHPDLRGLEPGGIQGHEADLPHYPGAAAIAALTTLGVLAAGVVAGILLGVILSLLTLIDRISHPPDAVLRELPGHGFHDVGETAGQTMPGLVVTVFTRRCCSPIAAIFPSASTASSPPGLRRCAGFCWMPRPSPTLT